MDPRQLADRWGWITGLAHTSSGLTCSYYRTGAATFSTQALTTGSIGTWASGLFREISAANMPGLYQFGIPDAALAAGADSVVFTFDGATNMPPVNIGIDLDAAPADVRNWTGSAVGALSDMTIGTASNVGALSAGERTNIATALLEADWAGYEAAAKNATSSKVGHALAGARGMALGRLAISGTTLTVYEADGTTVLATFTLASDYSTRTAPS